MMDPQSFAIGVAVGQHASGPNSPRTPEGAALFLFFTVGLFALVAWLYR